MAAAHPGELNMALLDGSVQLVSYQIDRAVHAAMDERADGDQWADNTGR